MSCLLGCLLRCVEEDCQHCNGKDDADGVCNGGVVDGCAFCGLGVQQAAQAFGSQNEVGGRDRAHEGSGHSGDPYREYKSNPKDCEGCPFLEQCTQSKNHQKVITRHVWEEYRELADEIRYTPEWKDIYPLRKETIERVYTDCKEKHGLRFTRIRGLKKNQQESLIIFGCHNLGKLARMKKRRGLINMTSPNKKERHIRKIVQIYQFA